MASPPITTRSPSPRCRSTAAEHASARHRAACRLARIWHRRRHRREVAGRRDAAPAAAGHPRAAARDRLVRPSGRDARPTYDSAATLAIFAVASIVVLAAFAWTTIDAVRRSDRDRNEALIELRGQREWLSTTRRQHRRGRDRHRPQRQRAAAQQGRRADDRMAARRRPRQADLGGVPRHRRERRASRSTIRRCGLARAGHDAARIRRAARHPRRARSCRSRIAARRFSASTARSPAPC